MKENTMENNKIFSEGSNKVFFGNTNKVEEWLSLEEDEGKIIERIKLLLKNYLELDNVSFLFGSGSSIHLGAVSIRNFPKEVEEYIKTKKEEPIYQELLETVKKLQNVNRDEEIKKQENGEIVLEYEKLLNYLIAKDFSLDEENVERTDKIKDLISAIKEGLFLVCDIDKRKISTSFLRNIIKQRKKDIFKPILKNKYHYHERFIKALLQRSLNLKRANIFTLNYDLAFEYAFDKLGVFYIDGFAGFHKRYFKPETFEYDMFYPGSTTSGKVQRIEKVVRYFKLHGSISWVRSEKKDANNLYGIEELPLPLIEKSNKKGEIIIYPSAVKKSYTLDFPYSELFRQFAATITQSQSVLITIGYSFADEHVNDIIFQALSNPTFTLIIFAFSSNDNIEKIKKLNDPRIIIIEGNYLGDFLFIADKLMPDFYNIKTQKYIAKTLNEYFNNNETNVDNTEETE